MGKIDTEIKNYKLKELYRLNRETAVEYISILSYLSPQETAQELFYMSLRKVQEIRDLMQQGRLDDLVDAVVIIQDKPIEDIKELRVVHFFALVSSIRRQVDIIKRGEQAKLNGKSYNQKWEAVNGGDRLAKFGIYNLLDKLADGDILKYEAILDLTYADVFTKLYRDTVMSDIEYEMSKIKSLT
tara:strand:- start:1172 stop:1726 length:555 start_codon:yes stop_codon:yes gene_type:complete